MTAPLSSKVLEIEDALVGHWSHFGRWPRGALVEQNGTLRYETPITELPYNGVIRTAITQEPESVIASVLGSFRARSVSCLWWVHPSASPGNLGQLLDAQGLSAVEHVTGMSIDLHDLRRPERLSEGVSYEEVLDEEGMRVYSDLIVSYWQLPDAARVLVDEVNRYWGPGKAPADRFVAFDEQRRPIGKVLLSFAAPPGLGAIYGMSVRPEARGKGVASALTDLVLRRAQQRGCSRVVLHSSEMAVRVYERAGFAKQCELTVYANAPVWADRRH